jgi:NAD(P)-dependent dehydrogenase (short-subunit alcohol dehydrogenase family)
VEISERDWDEIIRISLKGYFLCGQAVAKEMIKHKSGKIINIGSLTGHLGFAGGAVYGTAKGGIIALTRTLAVELAQYHIQVNAISPGPTLTPMFEKVPPKDKEARLKRTPAGRFGKPEDFVGPAIFFASEDSNYVIGQILIVDGGLSAAGVFRLYGY